MTTVRWLTFFIPLLITLLLGWLILIYCAPPLCWFLLSIASAIIVAGAIAGGKLYMS